MEALSLRSHRKIQLMREGGPSPSPTPPASSYLVLLREPNVPLLSSTFDHPRLGVEKQVDDGAINLYRTENSGYCPVLGS